MLFKMKKLTYKKMYFKGNSKHEIYNTRLKLPSIQYFSICLANQKSLCHNKIK